MIKSNISLFNYTLIFSVKKALLKVNFIIYDNNAIKK